MMGDNCIIVTGGAGFIGSAVVRHLINKTDVKVVNLDKLTYAGNLSSLADVSGSSNYAFEQIDICNKKEVERIFEKHQPQGIMHLAAESHVDRSIDGPADFINTNIVGTFNLLEVSKDYFACLPESKKVSFKFLHVSTDEVYGDLPHPESSPQAAKRLFTENTPYQPSSPYSASKASSDHLVRAWGRTFGLPVVITNCSNNYGPYQFPEKLIPLTILNAIDKKTIPVYGKGNQIRDWLFVDDHVQALWNVFNNGINGQTYNIGGNNEVTNLDVVKTVCKVLDNLKPSQSKSVSKYEDLIEFVMDRPGHDMRYAIDSSKITKELNWLPRETFESGIRKTVVWYLNNYAWYNEIKNHNNFGKRLGLGDCR